MLYKFALLAAFLFLTTGLGFQLSKCAEATQVAVVQGDVVNLRSGPGWSSPGVPAHLVVGQVRRGERLPVVGKSGDWVQVRRADGQAAWIAGQLVRVEGESLPLPSQPQPQPKPTEPKPGILQPPASPDQTEPLADKELNGVAMVRVDAVDVRSQPGNHYTAIAQATRGFKLPLVSQRRNWYQIRLPNGNLGWVESSAVEVDFEAIVPPSRGEDREKPVAPGTYGVRVSGNRVLITVESTAPMTYRAFRLTAPDRIVVDIDGFAEEQLPDRTLASPVVERIRTGIVDGQFRLVCDLKRGLSHTRYRTELSSNRRTLTIEIYAADSVMDNRVIVLDPGHGGRDPGAIGPTGLREKDVCLDIALEAARLLRQKGAQVILTRTSDQFVELARRAEIANQAGADVFVSIHNNANVDHSKHGISTYYWPYPDVAAPGQVAARQNLARALQDALVSELGRHDLGLYQARFAMLRATNMASALVEVAFISNFEEEELLADRDFRLRAAAAIAEGIIAYFRPD
jgi:N-acetylmuramoyl-L-alanine amidase